MEFKKSNIKNVFIFLALGLVVLFLILIFRSQGHKTQKTGRVYANSGPIKSHVRDFMPPKADRVDLDLPGFKVQSAKWLQTPQTAVEVPDFVRSESPALVNYPKALEVVAPAKTYTVAKKTLALQPAQAETPAAVSRSFPKPLEVKKTS